MKTRESLKGSGTGTLTKALRTLFQTTARVAFAAGILAVSGCTPTSGPDVAVATYGITAAPSQNQGQVAIGNETAPDQAAAVLVGTNNLGPDPLAVPDTGQAFVPGSSPPSAGLPQELAAATNINADAGAVANSGNYVTDGVVKTIGEPVAKAAPRTPSDVAGQVPVPVDTKAPEVAAAKQVATIEVSPDSNVAGASDPIVAPKTARAVAAPKPTLLGSLFGTKPKKAQQSLTASPDSGGANVQLASLDTSNEEPSNQTESMNSLPGVNAKNLFALDAGDKNQGEDSYEEEPGVQVASATAAGLARLAPNGLLKQTERVDVGCFKPELVAALKSVERHYGKKVVVTSGFRSPSDNRRAGGSRRSLHIQCAAADIQISGVGKWELAKYLRSVPGRGGVGTYCYTDSVHIDVGSERDWNWRCRRR